MGEGVAQVEPIKAPFPAFGGKSRIAAAVWARLGPDVRNYVEPFAFSAAVLLRRPGGAGKLETINDRNAFVSNFWRAVARDPEAVAAHADWPVNEVDLHARHRWLVNSDEAKARLELVREDPDAFDAKIAGWWCWGACCWIGAGWCDETHRNSSIEQRIDIEGQKITGRSGDEKPGRRVKLTGNGVGCGVHADGGTYETVDVSEQLPLLGGDAGAHGRGITSSGAYGLHEKRPMISADGSEFGRGVNGEAFGYSGASVCDDRRAWVTAWMMKLADRLRPVRVCCGHWSRVCDSPSTLTGLGTTGVFLDPPYRVSLACGKQNRARHIYANDKHQDVNALCDEVQAWCLKWGVEKQVRVALCGLDGEYPELEAAGWDVLEWKSNGGYGNQSGTKNENRERERVWFSPHCVPARGERGLFG